MAEGGTLRGVEPGFGHPLRVRLQLSPQFGNDLLPCELFTYVITAKSPGKSLPALLSVYLDLLAVVQPIGNSPGVIPNLLPATRNQHCFAQHSPHGRRN